MLKQLVLFSLISQTTAILNWIPGVHKCEQGNVCVYYRGGKLLNEFNSPGYHLKIPFITDHHNVQITWQTDKLENIICGSSRGGTAFLDIEVVNKLKNTHNCINETISEYTINYDKPLIYDYIPSEVAQFCKNYTLNDIVIREFDKLDEVLLKKLIENVESYGLDDCLTIKKVRISRPKLQKEMQLKFESIENEQKTKELTIQQKETDKVRLEIQTQKEIMEQERAQKTAAIESETKKAIAQADLEKQEIIDNMEFQKSKKKADSEKYRLEKIAEGNEMLLANPNYIRLEGYKSVAPNAKLIFGDVPQNAFVNFGNVPEENKYSYTRSTSQTM